MKISDMITHLHRVREEHGDLEARAFGYSDITPMPVDAPEVEATGGEMYVLLSP